MSEKDILNESTSKNNNSPTPKQPPRVGFIKMIPTFIDYAEIFIVALSLVIIIFSFFIRICEVKGPSMENTLFGGEKLIVSKVGYTPKRGDVVVFHQTGTLNEPVVKRVIATEGETVNIKFDYANSYMTVIITDTNGKTFILDESEYMNLDSSEVRDYIHYEMPYTVPEGCLFVMGDNRNHSTDSRSFEIGPVDERRILGKVIFRVSPFDRFGPVN